MNETTSFFSSWGFWLILGLFIGAIVGFFTACLCAVSGHASRDEERWEEEAHKKQGQASRLGEKYKSIFGVDEITHGKPDRD